MTLVELLVALAVGAILALLAASVFGSAVNASATTGEAVRVADLKANSHRLLQRIIGGVAVDDVSAGGFAGSPTHVSFTAWLAEGPAPSRNRRIVLSSSGSRLLMTVEQDTVVLAEGVEDVVFEYLPELGAGTAWVARWQSLVTAPRAVRLLVTFTAGPRDTLLFSIGERG